MNIKKYLFLVCLFLVHDIFSSTTEKRRVVPKGVQGVKTPRIPEVPRLQDIQFKRSGSSVLPLPKNASLQEQQAVPKIATKVENVQVVSILSPDDLAKELALFHQTRPLSPDKSEEAEWKRLAQQIDHVLKRDAELERLQNLLDEQDLLDKQKRNDNKRNDNNVTSATQNRQSNRQSWYLFRVNLQKHHK